MIQTLAVGNENDVFVVKPIATNALASRLHWVLESYDTKKVTIDDTLACWDDDAVIMDAPGDTTSTLCFAEPLPESFLVRMRGRALPAPVSAGTLNLMACAVNGDGSPLQFATDVPSETINARHLYRPTFVGPEPPVEGGVAADSGWTRIRRFPGRVLLSERMDIWVQVGTEYELIFAKIGPRLMWYINGERIHDVIDTEPLGAGHFGLRLWNSRVRWSDLDVYKLHSAETSDESVLK